jgi:hypothetical protein
VNATTQRLVLSFDFLGLPAGGVTPPEFGGFAGIARDTTGTASFFMAGTFLPALNVPPPAATLLVADGLWHHYEIDFSSFASTANLTSAQVVLEDWFDRGSIPGDVYFDNIKLKASVNAAVIGQLVPCAGPAPGGTWKNHGQYVSAVDNLTQSLLALGLISPEEQLAFVLTAGESECGRKK